MVEAYQAFEDLDRFAHVADAAANDFNLNIGRHADTTEPVSRMDALPAEMGYRR